MTPPEQDHHAPYAPPATVLHVIRHFRDRDVPQKIAATQLVQIGTSEGLLGRVMGTLRFLGLVEEDGTTTEAFRALRYASDEEYETVFRGILQGAYSDIFSVLDPTTATDQQLRNAFLPYSPGAQRSRMITLFLGLCRESGIQLANPPKQSSTRLTSSGAPRRESRRTAQTDRGATPAGARVSVLSTPDASEDQALLAWFNTRPRAGEPWSAEARQRWLDVLQAMIDGIYPEPNNSFSAEDQEEPPSTDQGE